MNFAFFLAGAVVSVLVPASPPAVRLGSELAFQVHQAPDPGAVGAEVELDVRGRLAEGGQVDTQSTWSAPDGSSLLTLDAASV
jgi:hypothetical protein